MFPNRSSKTFLLGILVVFLAGCATTESSRFYTLTSMAASNDQTFSEDTARKLSIGVGPVQIPAYLDRQQIVTAGDKNRLHLSEFDRWAGSLRDDFTRVLSENLSLLLSTNHVFIFPWRGSTPIDYRIEVEVIRFDGVPDGDATLMARWTLFNGNENKVLAMKTVKFTEAVQSRGYEGLVAAESRTLTLLSRDIAVMIRCLSQKTAEQ